jgi:hypothetical protein
MLKIWTILVLTIICGLFYVKGQDISDEARRYYIRGCTALEEAKSAEDFEEAVKELNKAMELAPSFPEVYLKLGEAYEKLEKCQEAIENLKKYLSFLTDKDKISEQKDKIYRLEYKCEKSKQNSIKISALLGYWFGITNSDPDYGVLCKFYLEDNTIMVSTGTSYWIALTATEPTYSEGGERMSFPVNPDIREQIQLSIPINIELDYGSKNDKCQGNFTFKLKIISDKLLVGTLKIEASSPCSNGERCIFFVRTNEICQRFKPVSSTFFKNATPSCEGIDIDGIIKYLGLY